MRMPTRPGQVTLMETDLRRAGRKAPPPLFVRQNPTRRLETWNSGEWSIDEKTLAAYPFAFVISTEELQKEFKKAETEQESKFWKKLVGIGPALAAAAAGAFAYLRFGRKKKLEESGDD